MRTEPSRCAEEFRQPPALRPPQHLHLRMQFRAARQLGFSSPSTLPRNAALARSPQAPLGCRLRRPQEQELRAMATLRGRRRPCAVTSGPACSRARPIGASRSCNCMERRRPGNASRARSAAATWTWCPKASRRTCSALRTCGTWCAGRPTSPATCRRRVCWECRFRGVFGGDQKSKIVQLSSNVCLVFASLTVLNFKSS